MKSAKTPYLVCYDYGEGGLWAFVKARDAHEISAKYPELIVFPEPAPFYDKLQLEVIAADLTVDIDDEPTGWLRELVDQRKQSPRAKSD